MIQEIDFTDPTLYVDRVEEFTEALYDENIRYIFLKGWSGAGKSYLTAQVLTQNIMDGIRLAVFRKVGSTLRASCLQLFKDIKSSWEIPSDFFDIKESKEIRAINDWLCMMFWLDDEEKIKSIANFDRAWVEEATEITYDEFGQLDLRLRGGKNHKIICCFNPVSAKSRLKTEVEDKPENWKNAKWISKTARDNKFVDQHYLATLDKLKYTNPAKHKIYALNMWGEWNKGAIYADYNIFENNIVPDVIGLDFGYNDQNALVYLKEEDVQGWRKKLYVQEKIYLSWQTSQQLINEMNRVGVPKDVLIVADSARPEMIAEIQQAGYIVEWVKKYTRSKQEQIDKVLWYELYVNWPNIVKEIATYCRKLDKKTQEPLDVPNDWDDHLMDAMAYGVTYFRSWEIDIYIW